MTRSSTGETGLLARSEAEFASAWAALALAPGTPRGLGEAARRRASRLKWSTAVQPLLRGHRRGHRLAVTVPGSAATGRAGGHDDTITLRPRPDPAGSSRLHAFYEHPGTTVSSGPDRAHRQARMLAAVLAGAERAAADRRRRLRGRYRHPPGQAAGSAQYRHRRRLVGDGTGPGACPRTAGRPGRCRRVRPADPGRLCRRRDHERADRAPGRHRRGRRGSPPDPATGRHPAAVHAEPGRVVQPRACSAWASSRCSPRSACAASTAGPVIRSPAHLRLFTRRALVEFLTARRLRAASGSSARPTTTCRGCCGPLDRSLCRWPSMASILLVQARRA